MAYKYIGKKFISPLKKKKVIDIYKKLVSLMKKIDDENGNIKEIKKSILEDKLIEVIKEYPELLYITRIADHDIRSTFAFEAHDNKYMRLFDEITNHEDVCSNPFYLCWNLLEYLAYYEKENDNTSIYSIIHKHPSLLTYQNSYGYNIAMDIVRFQNDSCVKHFMPIIESAIKDPVASTQQNNKGYNIGMLCAEYKYQQLFDLAYKNAAAREQVNNNGDNMVMIAQNNGLIIPPLSEEEVRDYYKSRIESQIDEICK